MGEDTLGRLITALVEAPEAVRSVLADWGQIDESLREHYAEELQWLLATVNRRAHDVEARRFSAEIEKADAELAAMGDDIERVMGFRPESILLKGSTTPND